MAQFRLRGDVLVSQRRTDSASKADFLQYSKTWEDSIEGINERSVSLSDILAYKLGAKVKPNDQVLIQFELGNDWYGTELVQGIPGNYIGKRGLTPWFSLAYAQWDPGFMHITAGIIPVKETCLMGLLGVSILNNKNYSKASQIQWGVVTNLSQTGLRAGLPVLKGDFKCGIDFMSAVIEHRAVRPGFDSVAYNSPAIEYLIETPLAWSGFTATPQLFLIPNRSFNWKTGKGDLEFGGGIELGIKINNKVTLRGGFGYAENSNKNSFYSGDSVMIDPFNPAKGQQLDTLFKMTGMNSTLGSTMLIGPGKLDIDLSISTNRNTKIIPLNHDGIYPFADVKYGWAVNKNFIIMPRCRFYMSLLQSKYYFTSVTRPELIFNGSF
jgi:hypothetical protein